MNALHFPWIETTLALLSIGALWAATARDAVRARRRAVVACCGALASSVGAWIDFDALGAPVAADGVGLSRLCFGRTPFEIDELSATLVPLAALIASLVVLTTLPTKVRRFSFARTLVSEALVLALLCCRQPWGVVALSIASSLPLALELRARGHSVRVYASHHVAFALALALGWWLATRSAVETPGHGVGFALVALAVAIRCGLAPVHCWVTDLFERGAFGSALLAVTPLSGVYIAARLLAPGAPRSVLMGLAIVSVLTCVYAAGLGFVQTSARRYFAFAVLSNTAAVLAGLAVATPLGVTGALTMWISAALSFAGLGLVLRSLEARTGPLSLGRFHGLHTQTPILAALFLIAGLAAVGFPGTIGFFGVELVVDGVSSASPALGVALVLATALNGILVLRAYGLLFMGAEHPGSVNLRCRASEWLAIVTLVGLVVGGSAYPGPELRSRSRAAAALLGPRDAPSARDRPADSAASRGE